MTTLSEAIREYEHSLSREKAQALMDDYFSKYPEVKLWADKINDKGFVPHYKMWNDVKEKHKYHALNYMNETTPVKEQAAINTASPKPIRSFYIAPEEYDRVVAGLNTQLALQERLTNHVSDQKDTLRELNVMKDNSIRELQSVVMEIHARNGMLTKQLEELNTKRKRNSKSK